MSKKNDAYVAALAILSTVAGIAVCVSVLVGPPAMAQEPEPILVPMTPRNFFEPYSAGPHAIEFEELSQEEKEIMEKAQQWAELDHGDQVHQKWKGAARWASDFAKVKRAEREAGLEGIGDLGVQ